MATRTSPRFRPSSEPARSAPRHAPQVVLPSSHRRWNPSRRCCRSSKRDPKEPGGIVGRRLLQVAIVDVVLFALAQLVRPPRTNRPIDASRTIETRLGSVNGLAAVLNRSCGDCHSNRTCCSGWYSRVAPLSWAYVYAVGKGRKVVNFSEWSSYPPEV